MELLGVVTAAGETVKQNNNNSIKTHICINTLIGPVPKESELPN